MQRLALARALYRQPEILILDEATSNLDSESEQFVHQTIRQLVQEGKTIILIAHRLSAVVDANEIIVLQDGKVTEHGTHAVLFAQKGYYYRMWEQQMPLHGEDLAGMLSHVSCLESKISGKMKAFVQLERLKRMNRLIKEGKTGDPEEFAARLRISPSHLYRCIEDMKELGAPVNFSRSRHTYYYEYDFDIKVSYSVQLISENKAKKIIGGFFLRNTSLLFYESGRL